MGIEVKDVKQLMDQVTIYIEMAGVAAMGIKAINDLLKKGNDLSQAELQELLISNKKIIDENRKKVEATITRDSN